MHDCFPSSVLTVTTVIVSMHHIGYSAQLYCLWEYESVHVCGKVLEEELAIPTSEPELEWFIDGRCIAALLSLRVGEMFVYGNPYCSVLLVFIFQSSFVFLPFCVTLRLTF